MLFARLWIQKTIVTLLVTGVCVGHKTRKVTDGEEKILMEGVRGVRGHVIRRKELGVIWE